MVVIFVKNQPRCMWSAGRQESAPMSQPRLVTDRGRASRRLNGATEYTCLRCGGRLAPNAAHATFQTQIPEAADSDVVIAIFRNRLGTELPPDFPRMPDGEHYPSGAA